MEKQKESLLNGYPNVISYECTKKIIEQMERNICKINIGEQQGTGFFTKIPFPNQNNMLPVLITNNHIINNDTLNKKNIKIKIYIKEDEDVKEIILNKRMKYTNEEYDTTIIEIKKEDNINNYLELDDIIINDISNNINKNKEYINKTIYIIQYPENNLSVSYGILDNIYEDKKYDFNHKCSTKFGSSGSPILNISNKIIGIHKEGYNNKYNIGTFLNYPIREFIQLNINNNEVLLKAFNSKYKLDIKSNKIHKLDLSCKNFGNEILNDLSKIEFKELKELDLGSNKISDINVLDKFKFNKLEILNLGDNHISDINILGNVNFNELKKLYLDRNKISDIKVLEKFKFDKLEILYLGSNQIKDINILENVKFKELKELDLGINQILDIKVLKKFEFNKLEILDLSANQKSDINILENVIFDELKELDLGNNKISDIKVLEKIKFNKLEILDLRGNQISNEENSGIISKLKSKIKLDI